MTTKKAAVSDRRFAQGLELFEKAMRALGRKDYERAREHLAALLQSYPEERDLVERARAYQAVCERALEKRPAFRPKTFEELLTYGVFLHNRGEYQEALKYLHQAADLHPRNEHALYCLAAASARSGDAAAAIKALRTAIATSAANRAQARGDSDFDPIRENDEFVALVQHQGS